MTPDERLRLRTVIVDDERLARDNLRDLLAAHGEIDIVGEAGRADEAERLIAQTRPDLIFLDIQMPGSSGFELLERLASPPPVIFVTAFDRYAVRAFEVNALDYLLKPVEPERLAGAIGRVERGGRLPEAARPFLRTDRVFLDTGRQAVFLAVAEIAAIRAAGNYSEVIEAKGRAYTVRVPISHWEETLPRNLFILLDRSLLVNQDRIRRCVRHRRRADLYLADLVFPIPLGRVAFRRFRECLAGRAAGTAST